MSRIIDIADDDGRVVAYRAVVDVPSPNGSLAWTNRSKTFRHARYGSLPKARRAASRWIVDTEESRDQGASHRSGSIRLGIYATEQWDLIMQGLRPNVRRNYAVSWKHWLHPGVGRIRLDQFRTADIERLKRDMATAGIAASTQNGIINALSRVLSFAVKDGRIAKNVASEKGVRLHVAHHLKRRPVILDPAQVEHLAAACDRESLGTGIAVRLFFYLGLRANEMWALRVGDIDLHRNRVQVERAWSGHDENGRHLDAPKSGRVRTVPILPPISDDLVRLTHGRSPDEWLFVGAKGSAIHHQNWRERVRWKALVVEAGFPGLQVHDLRRSATTWMLGRGVPPSTVQQILGHSSLSMTSEYFVPQDSALDEAIRVIGTA